MRLEILGSTVVLAVALSAGLRDAATGNADAARVGLSLNYAVQVTAVNLPALLFVESYSCTTTLRFFLVTFVLHPSLLVSSPVT